VIMVATSCDGQPPDREDPHCDSPNARAGLASAHPVRVPGPRILLKEPLLRV